MKIAITGKGGAGKSTLAAVLAELAVMDGKTVLAVDADPDANLAFALGMGMAQYKKIIPISQQQELIEERTGARLKQFGQIFKLNPDISDVVERFGVSFKGIHLLILGAIEAGGSGCACPENVFLRNLLSHIVLQRDEHVILDMEAGIEHLGRGTAGGVDVMLVVIEPSFRSVTTAFSIRKLARQIGVKNIQFVGNKVSDENDRIFLEGQSDLKLLGYIPFIEKIKNADRDGVGVLENLDPPGLKRFKHVYQSLGQIK